MDDRKNLYDVIIVGSGPGGSTAAYFLGGEWVTSVDVGKRDPAAV